MSTFQYLHDALCDGLSFPHLERQVKKMNRELRIKMTQNWRNIEGLRYGQDKSPPIKPNFGCICQKPLFKDLGWRLASNTWHMEKTWDIQQESCYPSVFFFLLRRIWGRLPLLLFFCQQESLVTNFERRRRFISPFSVGEKKLGQGQA